MQKVLQFLRKPLVIVFLVLLADQWSKIWIKLHMALQEEYRVAGDWFYIHFTENPGMAFGMEFGGDYGKLALSLFRIVAVSFIGYYLFKLPKRTPQITRVSLALVFAGAIGNIIDSAFYGVLFSESGYVGHGGLPAEFLPAGGGYAGFLHGRVVDMLYFPLFDGYFPDWFPIWGGEYFSFFRPVFNIADAAISVGIALIILFQRRVFRKYDDEDFDFKRAEKENKEEGPIMETPQEGETTPPEATSATV